jgi:hypothetical protein
MKEFLLKKMCMKKARAYIYFRETAIYLIDSLLQPYLKHLRDSFSWIFVSQMSLKLSYKFEF